MPRKTSWRHRLWRAFYDRTAYAYDAVLRAGTWLRLGSEEHIRREVIGKLALPADARVLEVGCGTASNRAFLPAEIHYIGLDISRGMLARARVKCAGLGVNADFVQADATALPFAASCVDLVLAMGVLQHVAEIEDAMRELDNTVKPGGTLLVIDEKRAQKRILQNVRGDNVTTSLYGEYFVMYLG